MTACALGLALQNLQPRRRRGQHPTGPVLRRVTASLGNQGPDLLQPQPRTPHQGDRLERRPRLGAIAAVVQAVAGRPHQAAVFEVAYRA